MFINIHSDLIIMLYSYFFTSSKTVSKLVTSVVIFYIFKIFQIRHVIVLTLVLNFMNKITFFFITVGVRTNLLASKLISQNLKLITKVNP